MVEFDLPEEEALDDLDKISIAKREIELVSMCIPDFFVPKLLPDCFLAQICCPANYCSI